MQGNKIQGSLHIKEKQRMNIFWKNGWTIDYDQDDNSKSYKNCEKLID